MAKPKKQVMRIRVLVEYKATLSPAYDKEEKFLLDDAKRWAMGLAKAGAADGCSEARVERKGVKLLDVGPWDPRRRNGK